MRTPHSATTVRSRRLPRSGRRWLAAVLVGASLAMAHQAPVLAAEAEPPSLEIKVDDGHEAARAGDRLRYTVTVTNLGPDAVKRLHISVAAPAGFSVDQVDARGTAEDGTVAWSIDLAGGASTQVHVVGTVGSTPKAELRLASVACASTSTSSAPIVCASDSNQLPAGAAAEAKETARSNAAPSTSERRSGDGSGGALTTVIALSAMLAIGTALLIGRRRGRGRSHQALAA